MLCKTVTTPTSVIGWLDRPTHAVTARRGDRHDGHRPPGSPLCHGNRVRLPKRIGMDRRVNLPIKSAG